MVTLVGLVGLGDLARLYGEQALANGSFLFVWLAIYHIGFFWRDGRLPNPAQDHPADPARRGSRAGAADRAGPVPRQHDQCAR
ncbi:hypothetical protein [Microlunatus parietis]